MGLPVVFGFAALTGGQAQAIPMKDVGLNVGFYNNPDGSPILNLIQSAKATLDMEVYEMDDPDVIAAIRDAVNRGVVVHIVKEPKPVGAACKVFPDASESTRLVTKPAFVIRPNAAKSGAASCDDQQQLVTDVNNGGGEYIPFAKPDLCGLDGSKNCLEHGKIAVADSKLALVTSGNFNTTNLCDLSYSPDTCNRDYSYLTDNSDVVESLQNVVEKDRQGQTYDPSTVMTGDGASLLTVGPNSMDPLVAFVKSAKSKIIVENQYLKDSTLNKALTDAANAGVSVQVVVASACAFGKPTASAKKSLTKIFSTFDGAGIQSKMFNKNIKINGESGYLHAKAIVIDDSKAWLGSVNGSTQALTLNREFGVFFDDASDVQKLDKIMQSDFADQNEESWQDSLDCAENK
jgi:phosphatidylserine/phosphatidylglycerophosphate/cardiolipin synthase-like enzyme